VALTPWDLRHPWLVKGAWIAVALVTVYILLASIAKGQEHYSDKAWKQPAPTTYYGPLECWPDSGLLLICQRPYVPQDHGRR
jgi:hypothetical protein